MKFLVGVDEAGRGPLAGPVAVGIVVIPKGFDWSLIRGVGDSKKISPKNRETIFKRTQKLRSLSLLKYAVVQTSNKVIDKKGIVFAINSAMEKALIKLRLNPADCQVLLDGSLKAPERFINQKTIIKGDSKEKCIGLASIMAKVTRDQYMEKLAKKSELKKYQLDAHKGYGTKMHRELISKYGLSDIHRVSFCHNVKVK